MQDALVHEIQMIVCSDLCSIFETNLYPALIYPEQPGTCPCGERFQQHGRFPLLLTLAAAACCRRRRSFPYRPGLPGWAGELPSDN